MAKGILVSRLESLSKALGKAGLDGVMVAPGPNMRYITGVNSLLLERPFLLFAPAGGVPHLVAPTLEAGPYRSCQVEMVVHDWTDSKGPGQAFRQAAGGLKLDGRWGVEGRTPFSFLHTLQKYADPHLEDAEPILQGLREVKDEAEVRLLKRSAEILSGSFKEFPGLILEGMTEQELGRRMSDTILAKGATGVADVLVQTGERAADPHCLPSGRRVGRRESIVVDISSTLDGYYADMTRTFCLGESKELESVYSEVLEAEKLAIEAAGEGVEVGEVDAAARGHLAKAGMGKYFIHRTGHGLGLEVHETPYIVEGGMEKLRGNMFFTIEPGAYVPGKLGVRIEDDVMIRGRRAVEITRTPKEYGWWR